MTGYRPHRYNKRPPRPQSYRTGAVPFFDVVGNCGSCRRPRRLRCYLNSKPEQGHRDQRYRQDAQTNHHHREITFLNHRLNITTGSLTYSCPFRRAAMQFKYRKLTGQLTPRCVAVLFSENLAHGDHGEGHRGDATAARSSLSAPRMTILSASSTSGRCSTVGGDGVEVAHSTPDRLFGSTAGRRAA
jgi:hypothetical protein